LIRAVSGSGGAQIPISGHYPNSPANGGYPLTPVNDGEEQPRAIMSIGAAVAAHDVLNVAASPKLIA